MKKSVLALILGAAAVMTVSAQSNRPIPNIEGGVGPVEAVSTPFRSLPPNAQTFVNELFPSTLVASVTNDVADHEYEVKMSDGYEITFDYDGNWIEVETPDNVMLPSSALNKLVPENVVVETLSGDAVVPGGVVNYIEDIAYIPDYGYVVEYEVAGKDAKVAVDKSGNILKTKPAANNIDKQKCKKDKCKADKKNFKKDGKKHFKAGKRHSHKHARK